VGPRVSAAVAVSVCGSPVRAVVPCPCMIEDPVSTGWPLLLRYRCRSRRPRAVQVQPAAARAACAWIHGILQQAQAVELRLRGRIRGSLVRISAFPRGPADQSPSTLDARGADKTTTASRSTVVSSALRQQALVGRAVRVGLKLNSAPSKDTLQ
jgi:hypothetical protein